MLLPNSVAESMLRGRVCTLAGTGWASDYAALLLTSLGACVQRQAGRLDLHPALAWAHSGAMALTGRSQGPPVMCPAALASCVEGLRQAFSLLSGVEGLPGCETLGERAAASVLQRNAAISVGGACRLLRAADGWLALNLTRDADWDLLPAWLACAVDATWEALAQALRTYPLEFLLERGRLLGLALAAFEPPATMVDRWLSVTQLGLSVQGVEEVRSGQSVREKPPLVVDLSALWAGPLCAHLLQQAGARVIKVESWQRPDGARQGPLRFYDLLNHGKASLALDFSAPQEIAILQALLQEADIVIEASRPRALRQLGIDAEQLVAERPGLTWVSLSGYGRGEPQENWIAYGDDAGVAAGLSQMLLTVTGEHLIGGDAIADPLTGWHAALAALASYQSGGGRLMALSLCEVVRHCLHFNGPQAGLAQALSSEALQQRWQAWSALPTPADILAPRLRSPCGAARALGADNVELKAWLSGKGRAC